jgi:hypothetical protein
VIVNGNHHDAPGPAYGKEWNSLARNGQALDEEMIGSIRDVAGGGLSRLAPKRAMAGPDVFGDRSDLGKSAFDDSR